MRALLVDVAVGNVVGVTVRITMGIVGVSMRLMRMIVGVIMVVGVRIAWVTCVGVSMSSTSGVRVPGVRVPGVRVLGVRVPICSRLS